MNLSIVFNLLKEIMLAMVMKIAWKAVLERFFTRLLIYSLDKLKNMTTNDVLDGTVDDIKASLSGKGLSVLDGPKKQL